MNVSDLLSSSAPLGETSSVLDFADNNSAELVADSGEESEDEPLASSTAPTTTPPSTSFHDPPSLQALQTDVEITYEAGSEPDDDKESEMEAEDESHAEVALHAFLSVGNPSELERTRSPSAESSASLVPDSDPDNDSDRTETLLLDGDLEDDSENEVERDRVSESLEPEGVSAQVVLNGGTMAEVKMEVDSEPEFEGWSEAVVKTEERDDGGAGSSSPFVDIMSMGQEEESNSGESIQPIKVPRAPRPKLSAAQRKANKVKAGKARAALYTMAKKPGDSPTTSSPGPSFLSHEVSAASGDGSTREPSPDPTHPLASALISSAVSSGRNSPAPHPFAFPFPFPLPADVKRTEVPKSTDLAAAFANYIPPTGGSDSEGDEGSKVHRRKGKGKLKEVEKEEEEEEGDDRLYCICRQLYDPDRTMIACDKCENWYHLDCIHIDDKKIDLVDQFICPVCQATSTERTTWKAACARPTCLRAVAPLSKYCSDYCGIEVAATRLELSGIPPEQFWKRVVGARRREALVIDSSLDTSGVESDAVMRHQEAEDERALKFLQSKLSEVVARRQILDGDLALVNARLRYLKVAIRRWEILCQSMADALAAEGIDVSPTKAKLKGKGKKPASAAATSLPDAQCGFDVRLVFDSSDWQDWVGSDEGRAILGREDESAEMDDEASVDVMEHVCLRPRKKCERHIGWQKVRQADFEVEIAVMTRRLQRLADMERRIRLQIEDHEEAARFRAHNRGRTGSAIDTTEKMQSSPQTTPKKKSRAVGGFAGGSVVNGTATTVVVAPKEIAVSSGAVEHYEPPDEVFAFLSRSEQLRLRKK